MSSIIESLIEEQARETEAAREAQAAKKKEIVDALHASLKQALGDFYSLLVEKGIVLNISWSGSEPSLSADIPALDDLRLAPISIKWDRYSTAGSSYNRYPFKTPWHSYTTLKEAVFEARSRYEEYLSEERKKKIAEFEKRLHFGGWESAKTYEEAGEATEAHTAEFPDRYSEAVALLAEWRESQKRYLEKKVQERREKEAREAEAALRKTEEIGYIAALAEWLKDREEVEAHNEKTAQDIQRLEDLEPYKVYRLRYSLVASYEDTETGEEVREVETNSVYVRDERSDSAGYWRVDGRKDPVRYFFPVSIEPETVTASRGIFAKKASKAGIDLYFHPNASDEEIEGSLSRIVELPEEPERPSFVTSHFTELEYIRKARALLNGEEEVSDEF